ncbi:hypothetical protein EDD86DRAFT_219504 [Gorgonomyces haynaldii]|nr:hypothetical protein EDD86DRAFT_219504 [Gorgonomyces haynaldii]
MGNPVFCDVSVKYSKPNVPVDVQMASTAFFDINAGRREMPSLRSTRLEETDHPLRRMLIEEEPQVESDTLEEMIRQLRPRTQSMAMAVSDRQLQPRQGSFGHEARHATIESAMEYLRRQLRTNVTQQDEDDLVHRQRIEPRERLEQARSRLARPERLQSNVRSTMLQESFARWNTNRRSPPERRTLESHSSETATAHAIRDIYSQTATRLQRTREILQARQRHHLSLTQQLEESTRAIGRHLDALRSLANPEEDQVE